MKKNLLAALAVMVMLVMCGAAQAEETQRYWVFLQDKEVLPGQLSWALDEVARSLTSAALERRRREMPQLVDEYDLPVSANYLAQLRSSGVQIRRASRWLNAVSIAATSAQVERIRELPFVREVEPFRLRAMMDPVRGENALDIDYGLSLDQNVLCRIPELHARGLTGEGVLLCMLDTGARLDHEAFDSLDVVATYDFIFGDTIVHNEAGQDSGWQHYHGTAVLSVMTGYRDSVLIGPAYGASVLVAKTEWVADETPAEEDNYVAALEWADSLGALITSSSLGYIDWYEFEDLDGQTTTTAQAVNVAVSRGILVVTAAGNERGSPWNHIVSPADADSILAVGAVDSQGVLAYFSSPGPTADGRIKPDVCAMGLATFCAVADAPNSYAQWSGTSLATPIVAGIAALIMEANPEWTAQMVRTAMLNTASNHDNPDNDYGWGIVDAVAAADYVFETAARPAAEVLRSAVLISAYPNPVNGNASLTLVLPFESKGRLALFDLLGRKVYAWPNVDWAVGENRVRLEASDFATGVYLAKFAGGSEQAVARVVILK